MGRTNPTFRDVLRRVRKRWKPFRRGLRREDQAAFDDLLAKAGRYADAASYANPTEPATLVLLSILLAQQAELADLQERLADAEERLADAEDRRTGVERRLAGTEERLTETEKRLEAAETDVRLGGTETEARLAGLARRLDDLVAQADAEATEPGAGAAREADRPRTDDRPLPDGGRRERGPGEATGTGAAETSATDRHAADRGPVGRGAVDRDCRGTADRTGRGAAGPGGPPAEALAAAIDEFCR